MPVERPDPEVLTYKGVQVSVAFFEPEVATIMPMFGGCYATEEELKQYNQAAKVVIRRLKKLGYDVEG